MWGSGRTRLGAQQRLSHGSRRDFIMSLIYICLPVVAVLAFAVGYAYKNN